MAPARGIDLKPKIIGRGIHDNAFSYRPTDEDVAAISQPMMLRDIGAD